MIALPPSLTRVLRQLSRASSGVAMTEFALSLPLLLTAGLWGTEEANLAITHLKINQLAVHLADNAARIGDTSTLENRKIYESDLNDVLYGADVQAGPSIDIYHHGRVIISSLELDEASGKQYIHWQRCMGTKPHASTYGNEGDGMGAAISGMGPAGAQVQALPGGAVIFVEINYDYQPLVNLNFVRNTQIRAIASFMVRDRRDLSQIYQRNTASPDVVADCDLFEAAPAIS